MTRFTEASYHVPRLRDAYIVHSPVMGRVACFVSPHGFGHAARACAVMAGIARRCPEIRFDIFTEVPRWFFSESLTRGFSYHRLASDVGLVQNSPLVEDLEATVELLDNAPLRDAVAVDALGDLLRNIGSSLLISDISPLGLEVAARAGLPSILVENFTWDWIYDNYPGAPPSLSRHAREMAPVFAGADLRIQTTPVCRPVNGAVTVPPVARRPGHEKGAVRRRLGIPDDGPMVVVSMGGVPWDYSGFPSFDNSSGLWVVVPGGSEHTPRRKGRLLLLPFRANVYHPDLVAASDVVVSKLGYSTVAEAYCAGTALAYVARSRFPESPILASFVEQNMTALEIDERALQGGDWLPCVEALLNAPRRRPEVENGADAAARAILDLLSK